MYVVSPTQNQLTPISLNGKSPVQKWMSILLAAFGGAIFIGSRKSGPQPFTELQPSILIQHGQRYLATLLIRAPRAKRPS